MHGSSKNLSTFQGKYESIVRSYQGCQLGIAGETEVDNKYGIPNEMGLISPSDIAHHRFHIHLHYTSSFSSSFQM